MRQYNYKYRSYMRNKHGFVNMVPDAKLLHPYMGFSGYHGAPVFQTKNNPGYSSIFCSLFSEKKYTYKHTVKMFFPEIKNGVLCVDKIKYNIDSSTEDYVSVSHRVIFDGKYEDYAVINDFKAEFEIDIEVDFGKRNSIQNPVEISCDFIDVYIQDQKISLVVHDNNLLFIPYAMSYKTEFPPEVARLDSKSTNIVVNSDVSYGFILNESSRKKLEEKGFECPKVNTDILDLNSLADRVTSIKVANNEGNGLNISSLDKIQSGVSNKYIVLLPQSIFPTRMTYEGLPIFNSEINMDCCGYWKAGLCSPYFKIYGIPIAESCDPVKCPESGKCKSTPQYEIRNKIIDGYLVLADMEWKELDNLAGLITKK